MVEAYFVPAPISCLQCQLGTCLGLGCRGGSRSILPQACAQGMLWGGIPLLHGPLRAWGPAALFLGAKMLCDTMAREAQLEGRNVPCTHSCFELQR